MLKEGILEDELVAIHTKIQDMKIEGHHQLSLLSQSHAITVSERQNLHMADVKALRDSYAKNFSDIIKEKEARERMSNYLKSLEKDKMMIAHDITIHTLNRELATFLRRCEDESKVNKQIHQRDLHVAYEDGYKEGLVQAEEDINPASALIEEQLSKKLLLIEQENQLELRSLQKQLFEARSVMRTDIKKTLGDILDLKEKNSALMDAREKRIIEREAAMDVAEEKVSTTQQLRLEVGIMQDMVNSQVAKIIDPASYIRKDFVLTLNGSMKLGEGLAWHKERHALEAKIIALKIDYRKAKQFTSKVFKDGGNAAQIKDAKKFERSLKIELKNSQKRLKFMDIFPFDRPQVQAASEFLKKLNPSY